VKTRRTKKRREDAMKVARAAAAVFALLLATLRALPIARAQDYPAKPITLIAPWPAGGAVDALCRAVAPKLADRLGQSVIVENRPGAGSAIGTAAVAKALPDGYTLVMGGSGSLAIAPTLFKSLSYDPTKDFAPAALIGSIPFVLVVNPSLPIHSVGELVKYAKENPGKLSYGSGGPGSPHHLYAELLKSMTGIEMTHVPYKGSAPALTDVVAGHVPLLFSDTVPSLPLIREGRVRALGVSSAIRLPSAPEIPPIAEAGVPGFDAAGWGMIIAPAGTPKPIVARLHAELKSIVAMPDIQGQIIKLGMVPADSAAPDKLQDFINSEMVRWGKVVQQAGLAGSE
jgi:tripartite-type tricarboxylate transporter receptor subunit TctC